MNTGCSTELNQTKPNQTDPNQTKLLLQIAYIPSTYNFHTYYVCFNKRYSDSSYNFRGNNQGRKLFKGGNYYFLWGFGRGKYSREESIQGRKYGTFFSMQLFSADPIIFSDFFLHLRKKNLPVKTKKNSKVS